MAGASVGDEDDNPVAINVTPLVDIIFCLCVFFMISFKFKQIEGRFDAWLPQTTGPWPDPNRIIDWITDIRVALLWDETTRCPVRKLGNRRVGGDEELGRLLREAHDDCVRLNKPDTSVTIDAEVSVPWSEVVDVMNLCKRSRIDRIEFALQASPAKQR